MIKNLVLVAVLMVAQNVFAVECVDSSGKDIFTQPEVFIGLIENAGSCYEAKEIAESCARGSSMDANTVSVAYGVCEKQLLEQSPSKGLTTLLDTMQNTCTKKYENKDGTMYISMNAFCHLSAIQWVLNIATED